MGFDIHKITSYAAGITSLPDKVVGRASWLKQQFDARTDNEVKDKHNALIDALGADDGAGSLGARPPAGDGVTELPAGTPHTVQGVLAALLTLAAGFIARRDNPHGVTAAQTGAYSRAETDAAISQRVVEIGSGDMAKAVYDPDNDGLVDLAADAVCLGGQPAAYYKSRRYQAALPAQRRFYYLAGPASGAAARPQAGDAVPEGYTEYSAPVQLPAANDAPLYVQVVKAAGGKVLAWGEASAVPTAAPAPQQAEEAGDGAADGPAPGGTAATGGSELAVELTPGRRGGDPGGPIVHRGLAAAGGRQLHPDRALRGRNGGHCDAGADDHPNRGERNRPGPA